MLDTAAGGWYYIGGAGIRQAEKTERRGQTMAYKNSRQNAAEIKTSSEKNEKKPEKQRNNSCNSDNQKNSCNSSKGEIYQEVQS